jgi:RNA polymerase-binding transcription factor DksA
MADLCDTASALAERERTAILRRLPRPPAPGAVYCRACGDPVTAGRRAACPGATLCADCAGDLETRRLRRARTGV